MKTYISKYDLPRLSAELTLLVLGLSNFGTGWAAETGVVSSATESQAVGHSEKESKDFKRPSGVGLSIFLGADLGWGYMVPDDKRESLKTGPQVNPRAYLSLFTDVVELGIGGGYFRSELAGSSDTRLNDEGTVEDAKETTVITTMGSASVSGNIRMSEVWQFGLTATMMLGTDASFSPDENKKHQDPASFVGTQLLWTSPGWVNPRGLGPSGGWPLRFGVHYMTDVNVVERQLHVVMGSMAIGIPIIERKTIVVEKEEKRQTTVVKTETVEKTVPKYKPVPVVAVIFDEAAINFETASATLSAKSREFLLAIGRYLGGDGTKSWNKLRVEGHTDPRGSREFNLKLSDDRAGSVRAVLVEAGVAPQRVSAKGYGSERMIDHGPTDVALARNRRVELLFEGTVDELRLRDELAKIRAKFP